MDSEYVIFYHYLVFCLYSGREYEVEGRNAEHPAQYLSVRDAQLYPFHYGTLDLVHQIHLDVTPLKSGRGSNDGRGNQPTCLRPVRSKCK